MSELSYTDLRRHAKQCLAEVLALRKSYRELYASIVHHEKFSDHKETFLYDVINMNTLYGIFNRKSYSYRAPESLDSAKRKELGSQFTMYRLAARRRHKELKDYFANNQEKDREELDKISQKIREFCELYVQEWQPKIKKAMASRKWPTALKLIKEVRAKTDDESGKRDDFGLIDTTRRRYRFATKGNEAIKNLSVVQHELLAWEWEIDRELKKNPKYLIKEIADNIDILAGRDCTFAQLAGKFKLYHFCEFIRSIYYDVQALQKLEHLPETTAELSNTLDQLFQSLDIVRDKYRDYERARLKTFPKRPSPSAAIKAEEKQLVAEINAELITSKKIIKSAAQVVKTMLPPRERGR